MKNKFKSIMRFVVVLVLVISNQVLAQVPFPRIKSLERIEQQFRSPAPKLLPATPENYGANIVGLISWGYAQKAKDYALKHPSPVAKIDKSMIAIIDDIIVKETNFKSDIKRALTYYKNKDAENLNKMLNTMITDQYKYSRYPYTADMFTNIVYNADLDEALTPYRAMIADIENDTKVMHKYLLDAKYDRQLLWERF